MTRTIFRWMILIWWVLAIICIVVSAAGERYLLPSELASYIDSQAVAEETTFDLIVLAIAGFLLVAMIIASIGLYKFNGWGRTLFLWSNILSIAIFAAIGPFVSSGILGTISYVDSLLTGGILFTMYLPPIEQFFDKEVNNLNSGRGSSVA